MAISQAYNETPDYITPYTSEELRMKGWFVTDLSAVKTVRSNDDSVGYRTTIAVIYFTFSLTIYQEYSTRDPQQVMSKAGVCSKYLNFEHALDAAESILKGVKF